MTKFNPENKKDLTYGDILEPAMKITDREDAQQYLKSYIDYIQADLDKEKKKDDAAQIAKHNLGYFAGYYSNETRERVEKLFSCEHPLFGSIKEKGAPTAKEAFEIGKSLGEKARRKREGI